MTKPVSRSAQRPLAVRAFERAWLVNQPYFGARRGDRELLIPVKVFQPQQGVIICVAYPPGWQWSPQKRIRQTKQSMEDV